MKEIKVGTVYVSEAEVGEKELAVNVGSGDLRVFATPMMSLRSSPVFIYVFSYSPKAVNGSAQKASKKARSSAAGLLKPCFIFQYLSP